MTPRRLPAGGSDEGSVTLFCCIASAGLLVLLGLVVDGGAKVRAIERADRLAAEAGRAGGQSIDIPAAITGTSPVVDAEGAVRSAQTYLQEQGATGTVRVVDGGRALVVDVTTTGPTVFLGIIGINSISAHGSAKVTLVRGVTGANR
jgi:hypothetical protein